MISILLFALAICKGHGAGDIHNITDPTNQEIGNAFLLTLGAGSSTVIGAAVAFTMKKEDLAKERSTFLAGCLSFAAAVMVYVSFIEIWPASHEAYEEVADTEQVAHIFTSMTFFGGIFVGYICSKAVDSCKLGPAEAVVQQNDEKKTEDVEMGKSVPGGGDDDSQSASLIITDKETEKAGLLRTGIVTAVSIALHNFPEGIVTFLSALADWHVGVATAFAIAVHNIPEGISIAVPYYYASESRWKAFVVAFLSGMAEPVGALIGWAIVHNVWEDDVFGVMFGVTAGIMVYISFCELLPLARKNDPSDKVVTMCVFVGFFVMDLSLWIVEE